MLSLPTAIATNRFGLGARPGDAASIADDPLGWLESQIDATDARAPASGTPPSAAVLNQIRELRLARQAVRARRTGTPPEVDAEAIREFGRFVAQSYQEQAAAMLVGAIGADSPFHERLVQFWTNHFAISADKQPVGALVGHYQTEAIRPRVTGSFRALLRAAIAHPAMLLYLDNPTSIGPNSLLGTRASRNDRRVGLNENLAREILELHTLGVDGGYTQDDVVEFARSLTGWSIGGEGPGQGPIAGAIVRRLGTGDAAQPGEFAFRAALHEPGSKTILGQRFAEGGVEETEGVLDFLAMQPATAHFLATKLARHFVADVPPPALVDRLARTYLDSDTELVPVYRELLRADDAWREPLAKYKTPQDFLISTFRAIGTTPPPNRLVALATELGQRPQTPGSPAGWPDIADAWNGGDALLKRIELATTIGSSIGDRIDAVARLDQVLGATAGESTRTGVRRAESGAQAITLLLAAPEFQRR